MAVRPLSGGAGVRSTQLDSWSKRLRIAAAHLRATTFNPLSARELDELAHELDKWALKRKETALVRRAPLVSKAIN